MATKAFRSLTESHRGACLDCKTPVEILGGTVDLVVSFNRVLAARGEKFLTAAEVVRCDDCTRQWRERGKTESDRRFRVAQAVFAAMRAHVERGSSSERVAAFVADLERDPATAGWFVEEHGEAIKSFHRRCFEVRTAPRKKEHTL